MYPETASFPAETWVACNRGLTRSTYLLYRGGRRGLCGPETRIDNRGCFRGDALFPLPRRDHEVDCGNCENCENLIAWERGLERERLVSCRWAWAWTRGVSWRKTSFPPYDVGAAFDR